MIVKAATNMIAVKVIKATDLNTGVFAPPSDKDSLMGEVMNIGPVGVKSKKDLPFPELKIGDKVLYRNYGSTKFNLEDEVAFIGFDDVVGKVEE